MRFLAACLLTLAFNRSAGAAPVAGVSWPLEYRDASTNSFSGDKRTGPLIESGTHRGFASELTLALGGPPGPVIVQEDRYVTASACVPHDCLRKGLLWLDTKGGSGLGAIFRGSYPSNAGALELDSTQIRGGVPEGARLSIIKWLDEVKAVPTSVAFTDATGARRALPITSFLPPQRFTPPSDGPSFDCARAATRIETLLCGDRDLAEQDLKLSEQYKGMLVAQSDMPTRRQLSALQQSWLRQRDTRCEQAAEPKTCLAAAYGAQSSFLLNWIPLPSTPLGMPGLAKTGFQSADMIYRGQQYTVMRQKDADGRTASFNEALATRHMAALQSCALLVDLPVGTAHGNHSYGAVCSQSGTTDKPVVLVCDDDMIGHFGVRVVDKRKVSVEELAHFVADECFGG